MKEKPTLADIPEVLRNPVLIRVNGKAPLDKGWTKLTYEQTCNPAYQQRLKGTLNIGIKLGVDSNNLCSIDFDTDAFLAWFLEHNPELAGSFQVVGARGAQIYFYIEGERPTKVCGLKAPEEHFLAVGAKKKRDKNGKEIPNKDGMAHIGEFRAEGGQSVLVGIHPISKHPYHWPVDNPPITIAIEDIVWHPDIILPWSKDTTKKPTRSDNNGDQDDSRNGNHEVDGEPGEREAIREATRVISIDFLWEYFGFSPRKKRKNGEYENPIPSPFRDDNTVDHDSFSIYLDKDDQSRQRFKDHNAAYEGDEHRGDSFDFYQRATGKDSHEAFIPFMQLAEALKNGEEVPPYSASSEESESSETSNGSTGSAGSTESEEEALERETKETEEWYRKKKADTPAPIREEAFIGIIGRWVAIAAAQTECNRDNLLVQFLVCLGLLFGRYFYNHGGRKLFTNLFLLVLGDTGTGRKGTALAEIDRFLTLVDPTWPYKIKKSVPSGEAVVYNVRDKIEGLVRGKPGVKDEGVVDKRLLILNEEFSEFLKHSSQPNSTLTEKMREAWDSPELLQTSGKTTPHTATRPHISSIGHVTEEELKSTEVTNLINGFLNRLFYVLAFQAQKIPHPEEIEWPQELIDEFAETIRLAQAPTDMPVEELGKADPIKAIHFDEEAKLLWNKIYTEDETTNPILARHTSLVRKIAEIYALIFRSPAITSTHLLAAKAVMDHSNECALSVFADFSSNKLANKIMTALKRAYPQGLSQTEIHKQVTNNHTPIAEIDTALTHLLENKLARPIAQKKQGAKDNARKPKWFAIKTP